ncbi:MAG: hypothetical protein MUD11_15425 [Rhodobacteraceae bacterium]|jgi:hypothetical protein|nr:hypothetical protein [Paracoccaceae bacterium]
MEMRARLLKGATALLYLGPLLAGLGGYGWTLVPTFVAIFVLWQMIVRPHQWPTSLSDLQSRDLWVGIAAQIAVQILLVAVFFGVGRGIGGAAGTVPMYSQAVPVAMSFLSIPICRLLWNPWKGDTFEQPADEAPQTLDPNNITERLALADRLLQPLQDMNGRVSEADALRHLQAMAKHVDHTALRDALIVRVCKGDASQAIRTALVVQTTDPMLMDLLEEDSLTRVLQALPEDPALVGLFAERVRAAIGDDADLAVCVPPDLALHAMAKRLGGEVSDALLALARLRTVERNSISA